jgi:GNAT superfamily N-acetyltransferase
MTNDVTYSIEETVTTDEFIAVLKSSGLAERRPADNPARIAMMLENANLMVCARDSDGVLIGVSRCLTDFTYCCYCSDVAVDAAWQHKGVGRELLRLSRDAAGPDASFVLLSAPAAMGYYPKIGLEKMENCFGVRRHVPAQ